MSELRQDPLVNRWVIIAEERASRPSAFGHGESPSTLAAECPFCPGHERETCSEVLAVREPGTAPDTPGWRVRVVPNKFPALRDEVPDPVPCSDLYRVLAGRGVHEVIVEGSGHTRSISELERPLVREVFEVYHERIATLARVTDLPLTTGVIIKNVGRPAGASIDHCHSQLIAPPVVPVNLAAELHMVADWHARHGESRFDVLIATERATGVRIVHEGQHIVALCPYAPRFPYETWLLPTAPVSHFEDTTSATRAELADVVRDILSGMEADLGHPPYNYVLHSAPFRDAAPSYRWRVEILPRVTRVAGFEQATGLYINPISPERSAAALREHLRRR
ncbi:MAG: DUF4921 family protein [Planctomycetota bacterium]